MDNNEIQEKNNKKIFIFVSILAIVLIGIGGYWFLNRDTSNNDKKDNEDPKVNESNNKKEEEDVFAKISTGDFSGIAGEYVNDDGDIMIVLSNGKIEGECKGDEQEVIIPEKRDDGSYEWGISCKEASVGGVPGSIYPVGVPVTYVSYNDDTDDFTETASTDTDKIRIHFGHSNPEEQAEIFYKK